MEIIINHLDDINKKINYHYNCIRELRDKKQKIYNKKFYKINKSLIKEKVQIKKKGKYLKKNKGGLTIKQQSTTLFF